MNDRKTCICIKDGHMLNGDQFCHEGKTYNYSYIEGMLCDSGLGLPYNVNTNDHRGGCSSHSMGQEFFSTYFAPILGFLDEELFEI